MNILTYIGHFSRETVNAVFKQKKVRDILSAEELLRIEPLDVSLPKPLKFILIGLLSLGYVYVLSRNYDDILLILGVSFAYVVILIAIVLLGKRSSPLIFTVRGIVKYPYLAEFWEDIDEYGWETFRGITKVPFSSQREGTCLYILNKGTFQRNVETWTGHTMLAQYGIFFTPEQIQETEKIFQRFDIKKIAELDFKKADLEMKAERPAFNVSRIVTQITLYVVIPTISMFLLYKLKLISIGFLPLLMFFGIIDIALIVVIIWGARKR